MHIMVRERLGAASQLTVNLPRRKLAIASLISALILAGLAGCVPIFAPMGPGLVALSRHGDDLVVAVCRAGEIREIKGSYRLLTSEAEWKEFFAIEGAHKSTRGEIVLPSLSDELEVVHSTTLNIDQEMDISILVLGQFESQNYLGSFRLDGNALHEGEWLHSDGTSTPETCV